ncbi:conserved hypothetical protein (plasmid) [Trichormus variabilis ATCC 29413]|uniref:Uncharacterized protein n=2 Tax=Anabaena variabilis TaxID=264691 RepID=Q3M1V9_TRIV2|nr:MULTISPECIES: hypothetical protein [Nostocaceae]ABA25027.1 conserved hypothetical protein [Trichormus variabilis ATCC 29413]MBC1217854.1 hypothetical protein [Trichormus variabilis ARAD]MBC1259156.1 hypothetical protein [Trichormus variabilis V5]MBC1270686.1 hypothetical protein [Trichormus variabilis FSR]MBC1305514.1 hypothetical protein [Trichormus variabilis N2B]
MNSPPRKRKATSASSVNPESPNSDISTEDPASATIDVAAVEIPELTPEEQSDRLLLERKVERAFFEAGKALAELRDRRLYRSTHRTFEEYCKDRFSYTHRHVNYLIAASLIVDNIIMGTNSSQIEEAQADEMGTNSSQIFPISEVQVRPLSKLEPQQQRKAWQDAVQEAGDKVPTGRIVKDVVQRIMESSKAPNPYRVGEVCQFVVKDNPDLRGMGSCWCIVTHVGEFSCTVTAWNGEYTVRTDHLKPMDYSDSECQQMREICDRIHRLRDVENLEEAGRAVLKCLGELKRPYLTAFEEELLSFLEAKCSLQL